MLKNLIAPILLLASCLLCAQAKKHSTKKTTGLSTSETQHPNIILIIAESHRAEALGVAGNSFVHTPNIDQLANEGVMFKNAYVTTAICAVSRASILTGQYGSRHTINDFSTDFSEEALLNIFPLMLKKAGYKIGSIGFWGVGKNPPSKQYDYWEDKIPWLTKEGLHSTDNITQKTLSFLEKYQSETPFYLHLSFNAAHEIDPSNGKPATYIVQERYKHLYDSLEIPVPETAAPKYWNSSPDFFRTDQNIARSRWQGFFSTPDLFQENAKNYYRLITGLDDAVGTIVKKLENLGLDKNTIIIYTTDHGFSLGEHGLMGKWYGYENSIHIPMIVYDPRQLHQQYAGKKATQIVLNIDIAPSILSMAGVAVPPKMQGVNLIDLLENKVPERKDLFYQHYFLGSPKIPKEEGVVTSDFKYMNFIEYGYEELYDTRRDPDETNNLVHNSKYKSKLIELRKRYKELKKIVR